MRAWLTRRSRWPRWLRIGVALLLGLGCLTLLSQPGVAQTPRQMLLQAPGAAPTKLPYPPGPGAITAPTPTSPALVAEGQQLFDQHCATCHGIALQGRRAIAPSLRGVGAGPVDFYLSTGRMPLANPRAQPVRSPPAFNRAQINAIIAYVRSAGGGPAGPTADPNKGSLSLGFRLFDQNCAGCHQIVGRGGMTVGAKVPALQQATAKQVAEAVRMGPYLMPHFSAQQLDQHDLDSLARYVLWTRQPQNAGGWGIYNIGPIPEGIVAWFMGLFALVIVARLIGERSG